MVFYGAEYLNHWIENGEKRAAYTCDKCNEEIGKLIESSD